MDKPSFDDVKDIAKKCTNYVKNPMLPSYDADTRSCFNCVHVKTEVSTIGELTLSPCTTHRTM